MRRIQWLPLSCRCAVSLLSLGPSMSPRAAQSHTKPWTGKTLRGAWCATRKCLQAQQPSWKKPNQWRFSQLKEISQKKAWCCSHKRKVTYRTDTYWMGGTCQYLQSSQPVSAAVGRFFKVVALAVDDLQTCCTSRLDHVLCILRLKAKIYNEHGHFRQVVLSEAGNM